MKISIIVAGELKHKSIYSVFKNIPLGACYIGTVLRNHGHQVEILDEFLTEVVPEKIDSDVILISSLTNSIPRAYKLASRFRKLGKKVILGGPHVSLMPDEAIEHADHIVIGEGELVINDVVEGKIKEKFVKADHSADLDKLPFPDYNLIKDLPKVPKVTMLSTSRGCPFDCKFCTVVKMHGRKYRFRSVENVIKELKQKAPFKKRLFFNDDNFIANRQRAADIIKGMIDNDLLPKKWWGTQLRVEIANNKKLLKLMSDSKCGLLYIGLESINPETLKEYNKRQQVKDVKKCIKTLHDYGMKVFGMFVTGSDHDTKQTIRETADFCCDADIDLAQLTSYTPLPGTRLYDELKAQDRIITNNWEYFDLQHVVHRPKLMTPYELQVELFDAFRKIYSPKRVMHYLLSFKPNWALVNGYFAYQTRAWERKKEDYLEFLQRVSSS